MTANSIPMSDLGTVNTTRRDQYGRYKVLPPGGDKPIGYTRATTVAKTLDDTGAIGTWKAAMTVQGALLRPGYRTQWEALMASHGGDPWYGSPESKKECRRLSRRMRTGGRSRRSPGLGIGAAHP